MIQRKNAIKIYFHLLSYIRYRWFCFLLGVLGTALASGIAAGFMWFLKPLLNKGLISPNIHFIHWVPLIVIGAYLSLGLAAFVGDYFTALVARYIILILQRRLFDRFLALPSSFFDSHDSSQLIATLIYNIEQVTQACTTALMTIIRDSFYIIGLLVVMFINSWLLTLIFIVTIPLVTLIIIFTSRKMKQLSWQTQDAVADLTQIAKETIEGYQVVRNFDGKGYEISKFADATMAVLKRQVGIVIINSIGVSGARLVAAFAIATTIFLAIGGHHAISAGAFMSIIASMLAALKPLRNLTKINSDLQRGIAGAESVFDILQEPTEKDSGELVLQNVKGKITFNDIHFRYPSRRRSILKGVSFNIEPSQAVALVGQSGSGKSTIINLLLRYYLSDQGEVLLDDVNINQIKLASLRKQFAVVSQHITLFNDTIAKNVAYGSLENISKEKIVEALQKVYLWDFVSDLPDGLNTLIGEKGVLLSGGQRQRLAIARALLKDAPILILDEATSVLDTVSEKEIQSALTDLMKNRTTFVIAHRLSTIQHADNILVLKDGKIIESGLHSVLMENSKYYSNLYNIQFSK